MNLTFSIRPVKSKVSEQDAYFDVMIALAAGEIERLGERPSVNLALVIDRSGSMSGAPLNEAKRAAEQIVQRLDKRDRLSVIAYDNGIDVVMSALDGEAAKACVSRLAVLRAGGTTDLHAGWLAGANELIANMKSHAISRVVLLSDGHANHGLTDPEEIARRASQLAQTGITTTTMGLGAGFNENLMTAMAKAGQGNACYAENAHEIVDAFEGEFAMLAATVARNARVEIASSQFESECLNGFTRDAGGYVLPNVVAAAESWMVMRFARPARGWGSGISLEMEACYDLVHDGEVVKNRIFKEFSVQAGEDGVLDGVVSGRVEELEAAREQDKAHAYLRAGDIVAATQCLDDMESRFAHNVWVSGSVSNMRQMLARNDVVGFSKEVVYAAHALRSRVVEMDEAHGSLEPTRYGLRKASQGRSNRRKEAK